MGLTTKWIATNMNMNTTVAIMEETVATAEMAETDAMGAMDASSM
jgi:hypothetical protein